MDRIAPGAAGTARGPGLAGPRGRTFRGVDATAGPGDLVAVEGPSGSGRTCLLLALAGRMRVTAGEAEVGGLLLPRRRSGGRVAGVCRAGRVRRGAPALAKGTARRRQTRTVSRPHPWPSP
ncbi:hypothetical protein ACSNOK_24775 [Streptomyces sp. URMC 126]|uniref:hypothetical protein n=1 Tax=Streptomyces sp. URMC 126 TaxID=3423401 RepID=UPI003F193E53